MAEPKIDPNSTIRRLARENNDLHALVRGIRTRVRGAREAMEIDSGNPTRREACLERLIAIEAALDQFDGRQQQQPGARRRA